MFGQIGPRAVLHQLGRLPPGQLPPGVHQRLKIGMGETAPVTGLGLGGQETRVIPLGLKVTQQRGNPNKVGAHKRYYLPTGVPNPPSEVVPGKRLTFLRLGVVTPRLWARPLP